MSKKDLYKVLNEDQRKFLDFLLDEAFCKGREEAVMETTFALK